MKKVLIILAIILILIFGYMLFIKKQSYVTPSTTNTTISKISILIKDFAFSPAVIDIQKGEIITWVNNDSVPHQISFNNITSDILNKNQSFSYTFNTSGTVDYHCAIHPHMTGQIIVK